MEEASRVFIIKDDKILLIHRIREGVEYYVLPGGSIEEGETPEQAAVREAKEETNLDIGIGPLLWKLKDDYHPGTIFFFLAKSFKGHLGLGGPEKDRQSDNNRYILEWLPISGLMNLKLYPIGLKEKMMKFFLDSK